MGNSSDMENLRTFADQLWKYMVPKLDSKFASGVSFFRAQVVSNPGGNMLEVQRPVENGTLTLPCVDSMAHAQPGQQVVALVMGSMSNAIVIGDGKLNIPVSAYGPASTVTLEAGKGGMPFGKLVSGIVAVQEGSGDPSPDNVRPITGFTGMNLHLNDTVIAVDWQTEAGTVYGGTLDLLTGVLTVTYVYYENAGTGNWGETTTGGSRYYIGGVTMDALNADTSGVCNIGKLVNNYYADGVQISSNGRISLCGSLHSFFSTLEDVKAYFAVNPLQVVYKLATPITYQLTPNPISSLPGMNTIWSDTGDVTVEYGSFAQAMQKEIESLH